MKCFRQELKRTGKKPILTTSVYVTHLYVKRTSMLQKHENEVASELMTVTKEISTILKG